MAIPGTANPWKSALATFRVGTVVGTWQFEVKRTLASYFIGSQISDAANAVGKDRSLTTCPQRCQVYFLKNGAPGILSHLLGATVVHSLVLGLLINHFVSHVFHM